MDEQKKYWPAGAWGEMDARGTQVALEDLGAQPCDSPTPINDLIGFANVDVVAIPTPSDSVG